MYLLSTIYIKNGTKEEGRYERIKGTQAGKTWQLVFDLQRGMRSLVVAQNSQIVAFLPARQGIVYYQPQIFIYAF
jgi:hypothetical protein